MSTVNMVKYFIYKEVIPPRKDDLRQLVYLAYQTARDRKLYPKAVLIRSGIHDTTSINGMRQKDPRGAHLTLCYKDERQLREGTHVASHGYVSGNDFRDATHTDEKSDWFKKKGGATVWPSEDKLVVLPDIGYSHLEP